MRITEIITESREWPLSVRDAISDILGDRVTDDEEELVPGMYYAYQSSGEPMFRDTGDGVGSINVPSFASTNPADVAVAAHEAFHALAHLKTRGGNVHRNEKIVNNMTERWLRKNYDGKELEVALSKVQVSRDSYGPHHLPVTESIEIPSVLYHATYRPVLKSIKKYGLGGVNSKTRWEDSQEGVVYLALDPDVAESYAEANDNVPEDWLDEIVILKINARGLDKSKLKLDTNVIDNEGDTLEYHDVIPVDLISM